MLAWTGIPVGQRRYNLSGEEMPTYYPVRTRNIPLTHIQRERLLPAQGEVLVQPGERVGPTDVVARCQLPGKVWAVDVSLALGVRREWAARYMTKAIGDKVLADEVLAERHSRVGWLKRHCRAPVDGQIAALRNGTVLIETASTTLDLFAHIEGQIVDVLPERGVVISTVGAVIEGMWGSGGEADGVLKTVVDSPQEPLRPESFAGDCHGTMVVAGHIPDEGALEQAVEAKVRGIIAGSVNAGLCHLIQSLPFPVLVTEGFGTLAMSHDVFALLQSNTGSEAMLNAHTQARWGARRPEVLIPLEGEEEIPTEELVSVPLRVGMRVQGLRDPYLGAVGTVSDLPALPQVVESGSRLPVARVVLEDGDPALIALANLALIR
jgi:hypothetical protein